MNRPKLVGNLLAWFAENARDLPWRRTHDPYAIWVSEIMLQQTQVKTVLPYWQRWMRALPNVRVLARARPQKLHKLWEGLGYYTRVRNMHKAAQLIMSRHGGKFPSRFESILELPGIGRYTAGAISSIAFNEPRPILDGNVIRVLTRLFGIGGNPRQPATNATLWQLSEELVSHAAAIQSPFPLHFHRSRIAHRSAEVPLCATKADHASRSTLHAPRSTPPAPHPVSALNQSLMELGALVCTPRQPACSVCPLRRFCRARLEGRVAELPNLGRRPRSIARRVAAFVVQKGDRFLVRQRPPGVVNAHLWEFPNIEPTQPTADFKKAARQALGFTPLAFEPLFSEKHSITRYRITLDVLRVGLPRDAKVAPRLGRWLRRAALDRLPFASAHKQILKHLGAKKIRVILHPRG